jgi:hypothetical protein
LDESTDTDSSESDSDSASNNNTNVKRGKRFGPSILNEGIIALKDIELLSAEIQNSVRSKIPTMERISIIPHSFSEKPETRMARLFRNRNRNKASSQP